LSRIGYLPLKGDSQKVNYNELLTNLKDKHKKTICYSNSGVQSPYKYIIMDDNLYKTCNFFTTVS